jgi:glycerol-3-phosphate cytidylyltransferase
MIVGYTTGTFDFTHEGHFRILRCMYRLCDVLIVGLTTDELAIQQKRQTIMSFDHRRMILENCRWVSQVVEHHGESKIIAYEKLRFHKLFIGDDYFGSAEYGDLKKAYPEVELVTIPRTSDVCTTQLVEGLHKRFLEQMEIMYMGVGSSVIRRLGNLVTKSIPLGTSETDGERTSNVYHFDIPVPRNWARINTPAKHPNYPGVNGFREIDGGAMWQGKSWYPYYGDRIIYTTNQRFRSTDCLQEKMRPSMIVELMGYYGGDTLANWIVKRYNSVTLRIILQQVVNILMHDFLKARFVHGDVHCRNVLVSHDHKVSLIDFGWCTHDSFVMSEEEKQEHNDRVTHLFDLHHFQDSLEKLFLEELSLPSLWQIHKSDLFLFANVNNNDGNPHDKQETYTE